MAISAVCLLIFIGMDLAAKFAQRNAAAQETAKGRKRVHQQQMKTFFTWYVVYWFHGKKIFVYIYSVLSTVCLLIYRFCDNGDPSDDEIAEVIKDDMW